MTEIIKNLHQVGARELNELRRANLVIDMGGILMRYFANEYTLQDGRVGGFKAYFNVPILTFEIDEVDNELFYNHDFKMDGLREIVGIGYDFVKRGKKVVVICLAGQNRSGLVVGLILKQLGWTGKDAVQRIQERRENALNNEQFVEYLINEQN